MKKKRFMGVVCTFLSACTLLGTLNIPVFAKASSTVTGTVSEDCSYKLIDTDLNEDYDKLIISGSGTITKEEVDSIFEEYYAEPFELILDGSFESIGKEAFKGRVITTITFNDSLVTIDRSAFENCTLIESLVIPGSVTTIGIAAFRNCKALTSITLPEGLKLIDSNAFYHCYNLKAISIPDTVTMIGGHAFDMCVSLKEVHLSEALTSIGAYCFSECYKLKTINYPAGLTRVPSYTFWDCRSLESIDLPDTIKVIENNAFEWCPLTEITLPDGLTTIGRYAFSHCENLANVTIPVTVTKVDMSAFSYCNSFTEMVIPETVTTLGNSVFFDCKNLKSLTLPSNLTSITASFVRGCDMMESITIPDTVTNISGSAFSSCDGLKNIYIPDSVESIGDMCFEWSTNLESIRLSENVTSYGTMTFNHCTSLKELRIPKKAVNFADDCFIYCDSLSKIEVYCQNYEAFVAQFPDLKEKVVVYHDEVVDKEVASSCTAAGLTEGSHCEACNEVIAAQTEIAMKEHKIVIDERVEPTDNEAGLTEGQHCEVCGLVIVEQEVIPAITPEPEVTETPTTTAVPTTTVEPTTATPTSTVAPTETPVISIPAVEPTPIATKDVSEFVKRCYSVALGREADQEGAEYWTSSLINGEICGAQVGYGFIFSEEYANKNRTNEEFVEDLYSLYFNREPDAAGFASWVELLNSGESREVVFAGFANSLEFFNLCSDYGVVQGTYLMGVSNAQQSGVNGFVARLYKICLNRLPDMAGQTGWVNQLMSGSVTGTSCAYGFVFSSEFMSKNPTNEEFVAYMYRAFFGREADETGFNSWVADLNSGASYEDVFAGFAGSPEFAQLCSNYGIIA